MVYKQRDNKGRSWCQMVMAGVGQHYCLRWNNYQSNMTSVFHNLLQSEAFVDVTLACNESSLKAHKVVLSACSSYFQKLLMENPCKHPTIILPPDICFSDLKFIIEFVYRGEIDVSQAELQSLLRTADQLKIKGLCEVPEDEEANDTDDSIAAAEFSLNTVRAMHHDSTRRSMPNNKFRSRYNTHLKRKFHYDHSLSNRKYMARDGKLIGTGDIEYGQPSTINTSDLLDSAHVRPNYDSVHTGCTTVSTSTEEDIKDIKGIDIPIVLLDSHHLSNDSIHSQRKQSATDMQQTDKLVMTDLSSSTLTSLQSQQHQMILEHCHQRRDDEGDILPDAQPVGPTATPVKCLSVSPSHRDMGVDTSSIREEYMVDETKVKFETLRTMDSTSDSMDTLENHMSSDRSINEDDHTMHTMMITPELLGLIPSNSSNTASEVGSDSEKCPTMSKAWTQDDMELALDSLRNRQMSLTKASITYGIPSTTLWQRAHRLGIDTPKKEGTTKSWNEEVLNAALEALRTGTISANKASKAYGIPSSTLYKIARKEGIRLAAPFNAAPTSWNPEDLERALDAIRTGQISVQRAATEYGIPSGTLYGRCKREKIELSRSNPTPWSEDAMTEALETVRLGHMSINQAAIQYNLPYSSLYGRFKRGKFDSDPLDNTDDNTSDVHTSSAHHANTVVTGTQTIVSQPLQPSQLTRHQQIQSDVQQQSQLQQGQQQQTQQQTAPPQQVDTQSSTSNMQSQLMLLQYQHTPAPGAPPNHMQMYQPTTPS